MPFEVGAFIPLVKPGCSSVKANNVVALRPILFGADLNSDGTGWTLTVEFELFAFFFIQSLVLASVLDIDMWAMIINTAVTKIDIHVFEVLSERMRACSSCSASV